MDRINGTLQDRLVKALRLAGINDMEAANEFLAKKFLPAFNRKFEVEPASQADAHREVPRELNQVLSWEEQRMVQKDWTVVYNQQWYQLDRQHEPLGLAGKKVVVRTLRNGTVQLDKGGIALDVKHGASLMESLHTPATSDAIRTRTQCRNSHRGREADA